MDYKMLFQLLVKFADTRALGSAAIVLMVQISLAYTFNLPERLSAIDDFYFSVASDLKKVAGKIKDGSQDAKAADTQKYSRFCSSGHYFVESYIPSRPDARFLKNQCLIVLRSADEV